MFFHLHEIQYFRRIFWSKGDSLVEFFSNSVIFFFLTLDKFCFDIFSFFVKLKHFLIPEFIELVEFVQMRLFNSKLFVQMTLLEFFLAFFLKLFLEFLYFLLSHFSFDVFSLLHAVLLMLTQDFDLFFEAFNLIM